MERFVQLIVAGGLALVAGLWIVTLLEARSITWFLGLGLVLLGVGGVTDGIRREIDY